MRRDAGAVELDSLENCCGVSHRGFESHSLRFFTTITSKNLTVTRHLSLVASGAVAQLGECIPRTDEVTGSNPVCSIFNFTLRLNCGRWNYRIRCLNSPAPLLQATAWFDAKTVWDASVLLKFYGEMQELVELA